MIAIRLYLVKTAGPLSTQFSSFRREGRSPASRRCGDHRIRFGAMAETGRKAERPQLDRECSRTVSGIEGMLDRKPSVSRGVGARPFATGSHQFPIRGYCLIFC